MSYSIGKSIRICRESRGLTQKELAEKVGVKDAVISNWETGKNRPNVDMLPGLCAALRVSADELIGIESGAWQRLSPQAVGFAEKFDNSGKKKQKIIIEILEL